MNTNYTSTEFLQFFAICLAAAIVGTFLLVALASLLGRYLKKIRRASTLSKISSDFIIIKIMIQCSETKEQLQTYTERCDTFFNKHFKSESDNKELMLRYSRLLEAISLKEIELNAPKKIPA